MNFCLCTYTLALATIDILLLSQYRPTKSCLSPKYFLKGNVVMVLSQNIGRDSVNSTYRIIPKISPGAYIFQRPFLRSLFLEGLIFGGAYVRREICVSKSIGLACGGKEIYHFCFVLLCIRGQIPSTSPPGGLYSEGRFNGGFFALRFGGGVYLVGPIHGGAYFRNFTVL